MVLWLGGFLDFVFELNVLCKALLQMNEALVFCLTVCYNSFF